MALTISLDVRRRFILGKQGLWPGRRWSGESGTAQALRGIEAVQIDPVSVLAQSQHIVLWGRVIGYSPSHLDKLLYQERRFFDYGGGLFVYPMSELPYWRIIMENYKEVPRWVEFASTNSKAIANVLAEIQDRGPLRSRDFAGQQVDHYRGRKDTAIALYYLWLTGELMTHHRLGREKVYGLRSQIAPKEFDYLADPHEAEDFFAMKTIAMSGLMESRAFRNSWNAYLPRTVDRTEADAKINELIDRGLLIEVRVENDKARYISLASDLSNLDDIRAGKVPQAWVPIDTSTKEETILLSPLEYVSARGRARKLFGFDYIWEIYKPANKRIYGPYTMPILYGDQLVARIDASLDRSKSILEITGFWMERWFIPDGAFAAALGRSLARFADFLSAERIDTAGLGDFPFRTEVRQRLDLLR